MSDYLRRLWNIMFNWFAPDDADSGVQKLIQEDKLQKYDELLDADLKKQRELEARMKLLGIQASPRGNSIYE